MELNCPSLDYVNDMTWAEFQIRAFGFNRCENVKDLRAREIAWASLIGFHSNPKKLPKTKERFWSIGKKKSNIDDKMREAIRKAQEDYFKEKKLLENG
jgi:hypothetical protein